MTIKTKITCKIARLLGYLTFLVLKTLAVHKIVITDPTTTEILMEFPKP